MNLNKMKKGLAKVQGKVSETTSAIGEKSKEQMVKNLPLMLQKLDDIQPILKECGFVVDDMEVEVSIPPAISITVVQQEEKLDHIKELLEANELTKFQSAVLKSISGIYSLNKTFGKHNYIIGEVEISMSIPPRVIAHISRAWFKIYTFYKSHYCLIEIN